MGMTEILLFVAGLVLLIAGAEALVRGASRFAAFIGISPLVIGLTVVSFGTSAPEMAVSVLSALSGQPDIAIGNIVGSNILNVLLILGLSATIAPLVISGQLLRMDVPIMIGVSFITLFFGFDGKIGRADGLILFSGIIAYTTYSIYRSRRENNPRENQSARQYKKKEEKPTGELVTNLVLILGGLASPLNHSLKVHLL
jgi:cation:H+ antiporter